MSMAANAIRRCSAAILGASMLLAMGSAQALTTMDPAAAGLSGQAFQADALMGGEVSRIDFAAPDAQGTMPWQEHGFMVITSTAAAGAPQTPSGLGTDYTLFVAFDLQGMQPATAPGYTTQASVGLYAAAGVSSFGFDASGMAVAQHQGSPILVASLTATSVTAYRFADPDFGGQMSMLAQIGGLLVPVGGSFLQEPLKVSGVMYHPIPGLTFVNGGSGVQILGGHDVLQLSAVPEPATAALWLGGLALLGLRRRRHAART